MQGGLMIPLPPPPSRYIKYKGVGGARWAEPPEAGITPAHSQPRPPEEFLLYCVQYILSSQEIFWLGIAMRTGVNIQCALAQIFRLSIAMRTGKNILAEHCHAYWHKYFSWSVPCTLIQIFRLSIAMRTGKNILAEHCHAHWNKYFF